MMNEKGEGAVEGQKYVMVKSDRFLFESHLLKIH